MNLGSTDPLIYRDVRPGKESKRQGLQRLIADVRAGRIETVLVFKIDRLYRNTRKILNLIGVFDRYDVGFVSIHENMDFRGPVGKLMFTMAASFAEFERDQIKIRTKSGKIASAQNGNFIGPNTPFCFSKVKNADGRGSRLELNPSQARWGFKIYTWVAFDGLSANKAGLRLEKRGIWPTNTPPKKHQRTRGRMEEYVVRFLKDTVNRGIHIANRTDNEGNLLPEEQWTITPVPRVVPDVIWNLAQAALARNARCHSNSSGRIFLLSGGKIIDLSIPGRRTFTGCKRTKGGFSYRRRQFTAPSGTYYPVFEFPGKVLDEYVWRKILEAFEDPKAFVAQYRKCAEEREILETKTTEAEIEDLQSRIKAIETEEIPRIEEAFEKGVYDAEKAKSRLDVKNTELDELQRQLRELLPAQITEATWNIEEKALRTLSEEMRDRLNSLSPQQKKALIDLVVDRIEMNREKVGKRWHITATVHLRFCHGECAQYTRVRTALIPDRFKIREFEGENLLIGEEGGSSYIPKTYEFPVEFKREPISGGGFMVAIAEKEGR